MDKKFLTCHVKALDDAAWPHGSFEATLSAPELDRDGEIIDSHAFHPLPASLPIFGDHVATIATTVARAVPEYTADGNLIARGRFASDDYSQMVRAKVRDGFVDSMSVGFMAPETSEDEKGVTHIVKGELLEASFVPIPSLRQATVSMAKAYAGDLLEAAKLPVEKAGARNSQKDQKAIQQAHDALVGVGAVCEYDQEPQEGDQNAAPPAEVRLLSDYATPPSFAEWTAGALDAERMLVELGG